MKNILISLNNVTHRTLCIKPNKAYAHASKQHLVPIMVDEIIDAATEYPVVWVKHAMTGEFTLVAIMALKPQTNLYCGDNARLSNYFPRAIKLYPFVIYGSTQNEQMEVCVQDDEELVSEQQGNRLFEENGDQTAFLKQKVAMLSHHSQQQEVTNAFVKLLLEHDLVHAQKVDINLSDEDNFSFDGIYTIDVKKLHSLAPDIFVSLRSNGALQVIYAHLNSLKQLNRLTHITRSLGQGSH